MYANIHIHIFCELLIKKCFYSNNPTTGIFDDIYASVKHGKEGYLCIKIMEMLSLPGNFLAEDNDSSLWYYKQQSG